jgi:hypothetical protein
VGRAPRPHATDAGSLPTGFSERSIRPGRVCGGGVKDGIEQLLEQLELTDEERAALEGDRDAVAALAIASPTLLPLPVRRPTSLSVGPSVPSSR